MNMLTIVPSRGRPENIIRLINGWKETNTTCDLLVVVDDDDPTLSGYLAIPTGDQVTVEVGPRTRLGPTLNSWAVKKADEYDVLGFMGDDHLPRTERWDVKVADAIADLGVGIVYGDDRLQGQNLATAAFLSSGIVKALGYMSPPSLIHLYIDNAWMEWGWGAECLRYLPDVVIEHLHYAAGKAPFDERYGEVNSSAQTQSDHQAFHQYVASSLQDDIAKIRGLR